MIRRAGEHTWVVTTFISVEKGRDGRGKRDRRKAGRVKA